MKNISYEQFEHALATRQLDFDREFDRVKKHRPVIIALHDVMLEKLAATVRLRDDEIDYVSLETASLILLEGLLTMNYLDYSNVSNVHPLS